MLPRIGLLLLLSSIVTAATPRLNLQDGTTAPREKLSIGVNYIGAQVRWTFTSRWAMEFRFQTGKAESNYGDINAVVGGVRGYRTFKEGNHLAFYWGPELAAVHAESESGGYSTHGFAVGAFGGLRYRLSKRFSFETDLGPYFIHLQEDRTRISSTNLDFVLNSAILVKIF